jgi:hypothetical protein
VRSCVHLLAIVAGANIILANRERGIAFSVTST